jgi:hypothetical protein
LPDITRRTRPDREIPRATADQNPATVGAAGDGETAFDGLVEPDARGDPEAPADAPGERDAVAAGSDPHAVTTTATSIRRTVADREVGSTTKW